MATLDDAEYAGVTEVAPINSVATRSIQNGAVTPDKLSAEVVAAIDAGGAAPAGRVPYGNSGGDGLTNEAGFEYDEATNTLTVSGVVTAGNNLKCKGGTAFSMTLTCTPTANRTFTFPNVASDNVVLEGAAQPLTNKTLFSCAARVTGVSTSAVLTALDVYREVNDGMGGVAAGTAGNGAKVQLHGMNDAAGIALAGHISAQLNVVTAGAAEGSIGIAPAVAGVATETKVFTPSITLGAVPEKITVTDAVAGNTTALTVRHQNSGAALDNVSVSIDMATDDDAGNETTAVRIAAVMTDTADGSEDSDAVVSTRAAGGPLSVAARFKSTGDAEITRDITAGRDIAAPSGDVSAVGGFKRDVGPWVYDNIAPDLAATNAGLGRPTGVQTYSVRRAGSITGITADLSADIATSGGVATITVQVLINGVAIAESVTFSTADPGKGSFVVIAKDTRPIVPTDIITVQVSSVGADLTATNDVSVFVEIEC